MAANLLRIRNIDNCFHYDSHVDLYQERNATNRERGKRAKILSKIYEPSSIINSMVHYRNSVLQQVHAQLNPNIFVFCQHYCCNASSYKKRNYG